VLKVEFHAHTADDPCDRIPYSSADLIDRAAALGYDALAITLHEKQLDTRWLAPYAAERGIVLLPGVERTVRGKHVLLVNFGREAEDVQSFDDLAALKARDPRGLVIAPHPFFPDKRCLRGVLDQYPDLFDAVECHAMFTRWIDFNRAARRWARRHGKPMVGNGDVHRMSQLGRTFSQVFAERHPDAICQAVREGQVAVAASPLTLAEAASTMAGLLWEDVMSRSGVMSSEKAEDCSCSRTGAAVSLSDSAPSSLS
jgi:predicted metal-dependent phosphoesterase TrpH